MSSVNSTWREEALQLHAKGVSETDICKRIWRDFATCFKGEDSCVRTVKRFLHSNQNPNNFAKPFHDKVEEEKGAMKLRKQKDEELEAVKKKAIADIIIESVKEELKAVPYFPPKLIEVQRNANYSEETIVLMISDIQAGTYISKEATGGLNEYNWGVLEKQFDMLYRGLEEIVLRHKMVAPIENLHIHLIGDIVEGWDIFRGQVHNIDRDIGRQLVGVTKLIVTFLIKCRALFKHIHVVGVPGNHGRIGRKGENPYYVNYDFIVYEFVQEFLANFPEFTWQSNESWFQLDQIYGYKFLLFHGDDIRGWQGIPYYGIDRAAKNYRELLERIDERYDYMEIGHFHMPSELSGVTTEKFVNGCWPGGTIYSMKGLGAANTPIQKLFAVHPHLGVTYRYPILLDVSRGKKGPKKL